MYEIKITTDNKWKEFKSRFDVPARVLQTEFDWLDAETIDGFLCYRRWWYHLSQFERTSSPGWDGAHGDSYFSGVLIKLSDDGECYKIGTYTS